MLPEQRILFPIPFAIKAGRNEDLGGHLLALEIRADGQRCLPANLVRILNWVGVDLAVLDRLLALELAIEADELDALRLACLFERRSGAQGRGVVDGEDGLEVG